jgi:Electron transfer DM13
MRILVVPAVAALLLAGLYVAAGRITNDYDASIALAVVWLVLASALLGRAAKRWRPDLRAWVRVGTVATSVGVAAWFYWTSIRETEVDERVVSGVPMSAVREEPATMEAERRPTPANVVVATGRVRSLAHSGRGRAQVVELGGGGRKLTLTDFDIDPGPKVVVWLQAGEGDYVELGGLKGSKGDQQYDVPERVDLRRYRTVVFWCVPFSQALAEARLRPA